MLDFSYSDASLLVREDLPEAHRRAWERLASPGTWWTGSERVAIASEVRNSPGCALCRKRREALSPLAVSGEHDQGSELLPAAVEVVHQVTNDPGRLSRAWFEKTVAAGLSDAQYVEIVGVVVTVVSIDSFARGIGVPPRPLPSPRAGEPSRFRPAAARPDEAFVPMLPPTGVGGTEADLFAGLPRAPNVMRALSLVPDEVRNLKDLSAAHYLSPAEMMDLGRGRTLDRMQMELVAGRVAAARECFY